MTSDQNNNKVVARIVRCPQCGASAEYSPRNTFRPFCSERCRLIDLGDWAEGKYTVPVETQEMTPEELEKLDALLAQQFENTPSDDQDS